MEHYISGGGAATALGDLNILNALGDFYFSATSLPNFRTLELLDLKIQQFLHNCSELIFKNSGSLLCANYFCRMGRRWIEKEELLLAEMRRRLKDEIAAQPPFPEG